MLRINEQVGRTGDPKQTTRFCNSINLNKIKILCRHLKRREKINSFYVATRSFTDDSLQNRITNGQTDEYLLRRRRQLCIFHETSIQMIVGLAYDVRIGEIALIEKCLSNQRQFHFDVSVQWHCGHHTHSLLHRTACHIGRQYFQLFDGNLTIA